MSDKGGSLGLAGSSHNPRCEAVFSADDGLWAKCATRTVLKCSCRPQLGIKDEGAPRRRVPAHPAPSAGHNFVVSDGAPGNLFLSIRASHDLQPPSKHRL